MTWSPALNNNNMAYSAQDDRQLAEMTLQPGVFGAGDFLVSAGSGMNSNVAAGRGAVRNTFQTQGGLYVVRSNSTSSVLHPTADPTNPRIDTIYVKVWDSTDGGDSSDTLPSAYILPGTPTTGATLSNLNGVAPSLPNNSLLLDYVLVHAGDTAASSFAYKDMRASCGTSPASVTLARAYCGSAFTVGASAHIPIDTVSFDLGSGMDVVTNHQYVVRVAGYYRVEAMVLCNGLTGALTAQVFSAGSAVQELYGSQADNHSGVAASVIADTIKLATGDTLQLWGVANSAAALIVQPYANYLSVSRVA